MPDRCGCPSGLGYRFHRHPCRRAGEIESLAKPAPTTRVAPVRARLAARGDEDR